MKLGLTKYTNFMPFKAEEFDFSVPGLTAIEGVVENVKGSDGNGAGKSALFDGVAWCWYGRCLRERYKGDEVCHLKMSKREFTSVETTLVGGKNEIRIVRYRKHPRLGNRVQVFVGGRETTRGTNPETDRYIEDLLGMDFTAFSNGIAFGAREDVKSFFAAPDSTRKETLDRFLGLEMYTQAEKIARVRLRKIGEELSTATTERARLQERLATLNEQAGGTISPEDLATEELEVRRQRARVRLLLRAKAEADADLADADASLQAAVDAFAAVKEAYRKTIDENASKRASLERSIRETERSLGRFQQAQASAQKRLDRFLEMEGTECPTCQQSIKKAHVQKMADPLREEVQKAKEDYEEQQRSLDAFKVTLGQIEDPPEPVSLDVDTHEQEAGIAEEKADAALRAHEVACERLRMMEAAYEEHEHAASRLAKDVEETSVALAEVEDRYVGMKTKADALEFWVQGFGNAGLKSFLIEAEIPEINCLATGYCQRLLPPGSFVQLSATRTLKSRAATKEELSIKAVIPGLTESYAGASKGQKRRLDLSLLLAFGDLISSRTISPISQTFADEIFDGLDRTGSAAVVAMLREVAQERSVFYVTQDEHIKSLGDRLARVVHDGTAAKIFVGDSGKKDDRRKPRSRSGRRAPQGE